MAGRRTFRMLMVGKSGSGKSTLARLALGGIGFFSKRFLKCAPSLRGMIQGSYKRMASTRCPVGLPLGGCMS